jgi:dTDP-4-dehydrorhamnose 3,5-epimerase
VKFTATRLAGAYIVESDPIEDERGSFGRTYCSQAFEAKGLNPAIAQCSLSRNRSRGTLRGMHWQAAPYAEAKLVRCTQGSIYDVIVDLRRDSSTYTHWCAHELSAANGRSLYIPEGCAHGFLTLSDNTDVLYQMSQSFHAECVAGARWNDPAFCIRWPEAVRVISERDRTYPDFVP